MAKRQCAMPGCANPVKRSDAKFCCYQCSVDFKSQTLPVSKQCIVCHELTERRSGEWASHWRLRQTCGRKECRYAYISQRQRELHPGATFPPKWCESCGEQFFKSDNESIPSWKAKKYCDPTCAGKGRRGYRKEWPPKVCPWCNELFYRRPGEKASEWSRRQTCCLEHGSRWGMLIRSGGTPRKKLYPPSWGPKLKAAIRERDGHRCRLCGGQGIEGELHVHHIDYRKENIEPRNLITLCFRCHPRTNHGDRAKWQALFETMMEEAEAA